MKKRLTFVGKVKKIAPIITLIISMVSVVVDVHKEFLFNNRDCKIIGMEDEA